MGEICHQVDSLFLSSNTSLLLRITIGQVDIWGIARMIG